MTRKQALFEAIEALSKIEGKEDAIALLNDLYNELPLIHWTDKSIRDTVEQFIIDNGRNPTATDFKKANMPPHPVIKQKYKITLGEWLKKYYPTIKPDVTLLHKEQTELFIKEYMRIKPNSSETFNKEKCKDCKTWKPIADYNNAKNWRDLLSKLNLPIYSNKHFYTHNSPKFEIVISSDVDFLNKLLQDI